jgi:hypothetical protein
MLAPSSPLYRRLESNAYADTRHGLFQSLHLLEEHIGLRMCLPRDGVERICGLRNLIAVISPDSVDTAVVVEQPHVFAQIVAGHYVRFEVVGIERVVRRWGGDVRWRKVKRTAGDADCLAQNEIGALAGAHEVEVHCAIRMLRVVGDIHLLTGAF